MVLIPAMARIYVRGFCQLTCCCQNGTRVSMERLDVTCGLRNLESWQYLSTFVGMENKVLFLQNISNNLAGTLTVRLILDIACTYATQWRLDRATTTR